LAYGQIRRRNWRTPITTPREGRQFRARPSRVCVRKLRVLRRIFVGSLSERRSQKLRTQFLRSELACANSDSPSESSLANSGAIRSDGRKNPSAYPWGTLGRRVPPRRGGKLPRPPYGGRADLQLADLRTPFYKRGFEVCD